MKFKIIKIKETSLPFMVKEEPIKEPTQARAK
jgi:hypothetical protein